MNIRSLKIVLMVLFVMVSTTASASSCTLLENLMIKANSGGDPGSWNTGSTSAGADNDPGSSLNGGSNSESGNTAPLAVMDIYQQNSKGYYIEAGNPVYLTAENSSDTDGDILEYWWEIGATNLIE